MEVESIVVQFLCLYLSFSTAVIHSLQYFTVTSDIETFPDYMEIEMVDGFVISRYDSKSKQKVPMQKWMEDHFDQQYWGTNTEASMYNEQIFKAGFRTVKLHFNHTEGAHTYQEMNGCQWDSDSGDIDGHKKYGYDGEDFLSLDLKNMKWIAHVPQAAASKDKGDANVAEFLAMKLFFNHECIDKLKEYVGYGNDQLNWKAPPAVSVLKRGDNAVVCHATGFYPDTLIFTWKRDGEELYDDVDVSVTLPNPDGTFQKRVGLWVSPEDRQKNHFVCEVKHESFKPIIVGIPEENENVPVSNLFSVIVAVAVLILILLIFVYIIMWKKRDYQLARDYRLARALQSREIEMSTRQRW